MTEFKSDIEIARAANKLAILELAESRLSIKKEKLVPYGHDKAKIPFSLINELEKKENGNLILVTAMTLRLQEKEKLPRL